MPVPRFNFRKIFRRLTTLSGVSAGAGAFTADMSLKSVLSSISAGVGTITADMSLKSVLSGVSAGAGTITADMTLIPPTIFHILVTGQSNAQYADPWFTGGPNVLNSDPVPGGLMFNGGLLPGGSPANLASLVSLQEGNATTDGEIGAATMVAWLKANTVGPLQFLISDVAVGGATYSLIKQGTTPYNNSLAQVTAAKAIADASGLAYRVLAIVCVHGETDEQNNNASYRTQLAEWQSNYDTDIKAITGQAEDIPMFHAQQATYCSNVANMDASTSIQLVQAHLDNPSKVILAVPETFFDFPAPPHFSAFSHQWMGEFMAKAIKKVCFDESAFSPILITGATVVGSTIVVDLSVPVAPVQFDFNHSIYSDGLGFRYNSSAGNLYPTSAAITGPSQITLYFASPPGGTSPKLVFAYENDAAAKIVRAANVKDSDATAGLLGVGLENRMPAQYFNMV